MAVPESGSEAGFEPRIGRSVSLDHAAGLLGVSRRTIYNRIRDGRLQTIRTCGRALRRIRYAQSIPGSSMNFLQACAGSMPLRPSTFTARSKQRK